MVRKKKSKFDLTWTELAEADIDTNLSYLKSEWGSQTALNFLYRLAESLELISTNPTTFKTINKRLNVRRFILNNRVSLYYQLRKNDVLLITFWNNNRSPKTLRKEITKATKA
jgi:plasmid stabilization system protein ParE